MFTTELMISHHGNIYVQCRLAENNWKYHWHYEDAPEPPEKIQHVNFSGESAYMFISVRWLIEIPSSDGNIDPNSSIPWIYSCWRISMIAIYINKMMLLPLQIVPLDGAWRVSVYSQLYQNHKRRRCVAQLSFLIL